MRRIQITEVSNGFIVRNIYDNSDEEDVQVYEELEPVLNTIVEEFYEPECCFSPYDFRVKLINIKEEDYAETIIVTRHPALLELLSEKLYISNTTPVISHATEDDVKGKHVIGILPHHLSCLTASITEVALDIPEDKRGQELSIEELRLYYKGFATYRVKKEEE
jgi:hypothetical protein